MLSGMKKFLFTAFLIALASPALAVDYETPEYSGPSARIDSGGMSNTEPMVTRSTPLGPSSPDRGFDDHVKERGAKISSEMDRRRDEAQRIKEENLLKTNE